jgi:uncharacterized protein YpbB
VDAHIINLLIRMKYGSTIQSQGRTTAEVEVKEWHGSRIDQEVDQPWNRIAANWYQF